MIARREGLAIGGDRHRASDKDQIAGTHSPAIGIALFQRRGGMDADTGQSGLLIEWIGRSVRLSRNRLGDLA